MGARRAAYIPFGTAIPQTALIDIDACVYCGKCEKACPTAAIDFGQVPQPATVHARSVVLATGYATTPLDAKKEYRGGQATNVISGLDMERLLAPNGPYGRVLRPSDGKIPESVAYVQCAGSRDETLGVPYCSRVCCMYAIKQAMLLSGSLPLADITIYYMDIRTFGKGYEQFYQTARSMGINFVKAKVARIDERENGDLRVRVEKIEENGGVVEVDHDLVVLSVGMVPGDDPRRFLGVDLDPYGFVASSEPKLAAPLTSIPGVVAAGTALGPKDIVDSVIEASAASTAVALYLGAPKPTPDEDTGVRVDVREVGVDDVLVAAGLAEVHGA
jgi:heterodisulfide reductase subunit A